MTPHRVAPVRAVGNAVVVQSSGHTSIVRHRCTSVESGSANALTRSYWLAGDKMVLNSHVIDLKSMQTAGIALICFWLLSGIGLTVFRVLHAKAAGKPIRIDLFVLGIPVDIILVSDPAQIQTMQADPGFARLHALPTASLPAWAKFYVQGGRFFDAHRDQWFLAFEADTAADNYMQRRAAMAQQLKSMYHRGDVAKVRRTCALCIAHCSAVC